MCLRAKKQRGKRSKIRNRGALSVRKSRRYSGRQRNVKKKGSRGETRLRFIKYKKERKDLLVNRRARKLRRQGSGNWVTGAGN